MSYEISMSTYLDSYAEQEGKWPDAATDDAYVNNTASTTRHRSV